MQNTITVKPALPEQTITKRLSIVPLVPSDGSFILSLLNSPGWIRFIGDRNVKTEEAAVGYVLKIIENPEVHYWVVRLKDDHAPVGIVTMLKRHYLDHPDIGFAFLPEFTGQGYAFEATQAFLEKIKESTEHSAILAITIPENAHSIRLLTRLGFSFERVIETGNERLQLFRRCL